MTRLRPWRLLLALCALGLTCCLAKSVSESRAPMMSLDDVEDRLQECAVVQELNAQRAAARGGHHDDGNLAASSLSQRLFSVLFPGGPAANALLATLYISGPPNFLLALCPPNIDPASLSVMVAFAVGGLMGDTLFHLLPEIFVGEEGGGGGARFVLVEPNRNLLLGVAILVGFMTFVAMDKGLRIATGGSGAHDHAHGPAHPAPRQDEIASSTGVERTQKPGEVRSRGKEGGSKTKTDSAGKDKEISSSVKLGGYLNLIADFTHNITDGLAMAASFYASPTVGATTTVAVFFHEIPHEVGDFALLVQSGFSKRAAMGAQFVTALGALLGTLIGVAVQEFGGGSSGGSSAAKGASLPLDGGLLGTSLTWGDLLLPFTAGTFLYVGTVGVIPELLETEAGGRKAAEVRKTLVQFLAIAAGAGIMLYISWHD